MKKLLLFITVALFFSCTNQNNTKYIGSFSVNEEIDTTKTIIIKKYSIDLDLDDKLDTIILENIEDFVGDPQLFTIIKIHFANGNKTIIHNVSGYKMDAKTKKEFPNKLNSDIIYIPKFTNNENYLVIWDYQYPSCDAVVSVFKIHINEVNQVFKKSIYISHIGDFNKNGKLDFKGILSCEENEKSSIFRIE